MVTTAPASSTTGNHQTRDLLALTLLDGVGPTITARLLHTFDTPAAALEAPRAALESIAGIGSTKARAILDSRVDARDRADRAIEHAASLNVRVLPITDPAYPTLLARIPDPPPVLFVAGTLHHAEPGLAIVGTRNASHYGIEQAERFATTLGSAGLTIVSGGARGVDTAAHRAARRAGARTVVVLGSGHANLYPDENADLFRDIAAGNGAVVAELPPDVRPSPETFPRRNRIIAGLALGTLVIEAPKRSGALITARQTVEDMGRDAMALPNRVDVASAQGSNALIRDGHAAPVLEPADVTGILESRARQLAVELQTGSAPSVESSGGVEPKPSVETGEHADILRALREPKTLDQLLAATGLSPADALPAITTLEIQGKLTREGQTLRAR